MTLDRDIHDLLYTHDCVIVPGFGGFLTHYRPARLDLQRRLVHPPSKELSFNKHLIRQDGLLADRLAKREGLDFQTANSRVEELATAWRTELDSNSRLEVDRVGTFFRDAENNLQFEPDKRINFLKDAFGLRPVPAVPVERSRPRIVPAQEPAVVAAGEAREPRRNPAFLAAAAVTAILLTAATWWVVAPGGTGAAALGGFSIFSGSAPSLYIMPKAPSGFGEPVEASIWEAPKALVGIHEMPIAGPDERNVAVNFGQVPVKAAPESTAVAVPAVRSKYHVIGGCFLEKENADRFIAVLQAKGFAASLVDRKGGLYRVAYGSYPLRGTALEALNAVRKEEAPDAWMLVK